MLRTLHEALWKDVSRSVPATSEEGKLHPKLHFDSKAQGRRDKGSKAQEAPQTAAAPAEAAAAEAEAAAAEATAAQGVSDLPGCEHC